METEHKKGKKEIVKVLELEGHLITVETRNWTLDGNSFYPTLEGALKEMSNRILKQKLKGRSDEDVKSLKSLIQTIEAHYQWFKDLTKEM